MNSKVFWVFVMFFLAIGSGQAQSEIRLTLEEAISSTLKNNYEIRLAEHEQQSAEARFKQTDAVFLPQFNVSYTAMRTDNPLNAFGFKLQQQSIEASDFNPALLNDPSATNNFMTKAEWRQPLLNLDMLHMRQAAHQQISVYGWKTKRMKEYLTYEVQKAYSQLRLARQAQQVLTESSTTVQAIQQATQNRFDQGFLHKSDLLQVQVQGLAVATKLAEAKSNVRNASDYLSLLMGAKPGVLYSVDSLSVVEAEPVSNTLSDSRADFQAMESAIAAHDFMITSSQKLYWPKLNAFADYMFNDKDALGFGSGAYLIGAQLSWNLFSGMSVQNKIKEQRSERSKMETQLVYQKAQSELELTKTIRQLQDARYNLSQQELAVSQATEALRILQNRYQQGLTTTQDLLQAQNLVSQQKLYQAQALFQLNSTAAYLQFLTSTSEQ